MTLSVSGRDFLVDGAAQANERPTKVVNLNPGLCHWPRPAVCCQSCEHNILKKNELILLQIDASCLCGKGMKCGPGGGQRSGHETLT